MSISLYRRHTLKCSQHRPRQVRTYESDELRRGFKKCECPIQFEGKTQRAGFVRRSTEKASWDEAKLVAASWFVETGAQPVTEPSKISGPELGVPNRDAPVTMERAVAEFLADVDARRMDDETRRKYRTMLTQLRRYADELGFRHLTQFTVDEITRFRATWSDGIRSSAKKLERVKMFFRFAQDREWILQNPASKLKPPIGSSKPANKHPFSDEEVQRLFEACASYQTRRWSNSFAEGEVTGDQIQTFMMLLMYTGLRISDAATFGPDKLQGNNAFLFMHKTDEPVFTWIPDQLVERLKNTTLQRGKYYFMGPLTERKETAADMWRRKLGQIFEMAGPWKITPTPHRFRHTFARLLLQRGVPVDDVATLMGHSDPKITLKHYAHWVPERQERLTDILKSAWQTKTRGKLTVIRSGKKSG